MIAKTLVVHESLALTADGIVPIIDDSVTSAISVVDFLTFLIYVIQGNPIGTL